MQPDPYRVTWDSLGNDCKDSMPLGNGDVAVNAWTEANGDLVLLIAKADAWTENGQLVKLGRVRVRLTPSPFVGQPLFRQRLDVRNGVIELTVGDNCGLLLWIDANAPVIHLEYAGDTPVGVRATVELWRTAPRRTNMVPGNPEIEHGFWEADGDPAGHLIIDPDTVLPPENDCLAWAHRNTRSVFDSVFENQHLQALRPGRDDPFLHRTFGVLMKGDGLAATDDCTLQSRKPTAKFRLSLCAMTAKAESLDAWRSAANASMQAVDAKSIDAARTATRAWWNAFWDRSHIHVTADADADAVTQGNIMQRWMLAASGRGAFPLKFNGTLFTVGQEPPAGTPYDPDLGQQNADFRRWGGNYWFQNQRLVYAPMLASGDHDTLAPFFKMYRDALPLAIGRTRAVYGHGGAVFPETMYFFGLPNNHDFGWNNPNLEMTNRYIRWHFNGGLELIVLMLDAHAHTRDAAFLRETLLPLAVAIVQFFDEHATRVNGKLHFEPAAALETRQWAVTPAQDLAGLADVLPRLLGLSDDATDPEDRARWRRLLSELPPLPRGRADATGTMPATPADACDTAAEVLWPAYDFVKCNNRENPELYSVYPFRRFGVGLSELELAIATYDARSNVGVDCWAQDGIHAACLGDAARARADLIVKFTAYGDQRFRWFWKPGMDWIPGLDYGGSGQLALQNMLLQPRPDGKILLFPAWPRAWDVTFKLHAAGETTVECVFADGEVRSLKVTPPHRAEDVIVHPPQ